MLNTVSFFRVIKAGFVNFWRNIWLSLAATLVMVITLVILSILLILFGITNFSINSIKDRVDMSVYFKTGITESKVLEIKEAINTNPLVKNINYTSASQALENFKQQHSNDPLIIQSISELTENPLPATLQIKAINLESYPVLADTLKNDEYASSIDKVNFEDNKIIIERLSKILKLIITIGLSLIAIFALIAILVIFNTITLTIYNRREEVEIMRLVGATNGYIRGPFIIEALLYSCAATAITGLFLVPFYVKIIPQINGYLNGGGNIFVENYFSLPAVLAMQFGIAVILSVVSSLLAIRRYLKI